MRRGFAVLVFSVLLMLLASSPVAAQQPAGGISWSAEALFDGMVKYGEWLPIRVTLSNQGGDRTVEVHAVVTSSDGQATFVQPVELPSGAHKQITLYVVPNNFSRRLRLTLTDGSDELSSSTVEVQPVSYQTFLAGIIARQPDALSTLRTVSVDRRPSTALRRGSGQGSGPSPGGVQTTAFAVDEIPDRVAGLASFDALVLNDVDTSQLTPAQQQTLASWVSLGGHLVVGGGAGAALTTAGLPADLLPVTLDRTQSVDELASLTAIGGEPVRIPGPFVIARSAYRGGVVLAEQDDTPLIVEQEIGEGRVTFVALDFGTSPFGAWAGEKAMWTTLLQPAGSPFIDGPPDISPRRWADGQMINALTNLPSLDLPSVRWVVLLLAIYILLVGPANYLILRRARRLEWAWITIPAMTLTFSVGAYGVGYGLRGGEVILNKLSIIEVMPGTQTARVRTYAGLFSPIKRSYSLTVDGDPLISPLNLAYGPWGSSAGGGDITVIQGQPTQVRDLAVNQWAMQTFVAETVTRQPVNIRAGISAGLSASLIYRDGRIQGRVINAGTQPLHDVVVAMSGDFSRLGTIAAGETADVDFRIGATGNVSGPPLSYLILRDEFENPGPRGPSRESRLKQQLLDSVFAPPFEMGYAAGTGPLLIAWLDESPMSIQVEGANVQELATSLVIARPAISFGDHAVSVPPGFVPAQLIHQEGGVSQCYGGRGPGFAPYQGKMTLEFRLPRELHNVDFSELSLIIESDGGWWQPPATALYDWQTGTWHSLDEVTLGTNRIDDANRFIGANTHAIRVRMQAGDNRGGCLYTDIALEGVRVDAKG
ncbi:MAG: hypothetical protein ACE5LU_11120 [Anaerolineae bacterium]